jgi:hypothetical protein
MTGPIERITFSRAHRGWTGASLISGVKPRVDG